MKFSLPVADASWIGDAPITVSRSVEVDAPPDELFSVLADHEHWPVWFAGMRRVEVDGRGDRIGTRRIVWVGAARVEEEFVIWDRPRRLAFFIVSSNLPGIAKMGEDWRLEPIGDRHTRLSITIGAAAQGLLRGAPWLVRAAIKSSTKGAVGIAGRFG